MTLNEKSPEKPGRFRQGKTDIVLLSAGGPVTLTCHRNGPADVVATVPAQHVLAAIEIKACPTSLAEQQAKSVADVEKLRTLVSAHPHIGGYFLLLDKSISIPGIARSEVPMHANWTQGLRRNLIRDDGPAGGPYVEIWDLAAAPSPVPRRRFYG